MKRRHVWLAGLGLIIFLSAGCGGRDSQPQIGETKPDNTAPALLADPRQGLDALDGYHASLVNEFTGTQDGKEQHSRMELTADADRAEEALFVQQSQTAGGNRIREMVTGRVGQAAYSRIGGQSARCHVTWGAEGRVPFLLPQDVLPAILTAEQTGEETVNAVKAIRYSLNTKSLGTDVENLEGDLWLAQPGGYVVKLYLTYSGGEKTFGKGRAGKQTVTYELTKINANSGFDWPAGCQPVLAGVPEMPGAVNVSRLPDTLRYNIDSSAEKVTAFYKEQLGLSAWRWGDMHTTSGGDSVILFTKVDEPVSLRLLMSGSESALDVSIARLKPAVMEDTVDDTGETFEGNPVDPDKAGLPEGVTIYPGAVDLTGVEGMRLVFNTPDAPEKVKDFYRSELKNGGWAVMPGSESTPEVPMMHKKDGVMLIILAGEGDNGARVEITWVKQ